MLFSKFGLADGLADIGAQEAKKTRRVFVLDPAVGTGTFLREVISSIRAKIGEKGLSGAWPEYVRDHLLPRIFGFELLMAPYIICHLKLALELSEIGSEFKMPPSSRLGVFLTNTLEEAHQGTTGAAFAHEIAKEASGADDESMKSPLWSYWEILHILGILRTKENGYIGY